MRCGQSACHAEQSREEHGMREPPVNVAIAAEVRCQQIEVWRDRTQCACDQIRARVNERHDEAADCEPDQRIGRGRHRRCESRRPPMTAPTPARVQTRTGTTGVRRLVAAVGAATSTPSRAPNEAPRRAAPAIHPRRAHNSGERQASVAPPTTAPAKRPAFPPHCRGSSRPPPRAGEPPTRTTVAAGFMNRPANVVAAGAACQPAGWARCSRSPFTCSVSS
jgi:hypothetical protein